VTYLHGYRTCLRRSDGISSAYRIGTLRREHWKTHKKQCKKTAEAAAGTVQTAEETRRLVAAMADLDVGRPRGVPDPSQYRFDLGTPVWCFVGAGHWAPGNIIALNYEEPAGVFNPYQIRLTSGELVYAPMDDDSGIRRAEEPVYSDYEAHGHGHGHSHGGVPCEGHGHAHAHGHTHGGVPCEGHNTGACGAERESEDDDACAHGHTHNGQPCHGHGH
jgi:hypothetical protein